MLAAAGSFLLAMAPAILKLILGSLLKGDTNAKVVKRVLGYIKEVMSLMIAAQIKLSEGILATDEQVEKERQKLIEEHKLKEKNK